jgi:hypothetical protein
MNVFVYAEKKQQNSRLSLTKKDADTCSSNLPLNMSSSTDPPHGAHVSDVTMNADNKSNQHLSFMTENKHIILLVTGHTTWYHLIAYVSCFW